MPSKKPAKKARKAREWTIDVYGGGFIHRLPNAPGAIEKIRVREILPRKLAKAKRGGK